MVEVEGRLLRLTNLEKILYPETGFTKGQVIDFYRRVAPALLPHLRQRPLTLKRYPNGVDAPFFFEKQCPSHRPDWVKVAPIWSGASRRTVEYCLADDLPTLVWVANLASLELHTSLSLAADPARPTMVVFDLDPGAPADAVSCGRVAQWLRTALDGLGLAGFPKTSGSKGLQVYVPLNTPTTCEQTKSFALEIARLLEREHPELVVSAMRKDLRAGKVLIDWSQNDPHKTTVSVYSLRALPVPTVSTPLLWEEVDAAVECGSADALRFDADAVLARVERHGDLFAPVLGSAQELSQL
ncbi:MAG: non-homologous end-joining DNA ligase [Acidimicrobiales bacterium]